MENYFKKFSIMFIMVLAIIGVGAIQHGIVASAATDTGVVGTGNLNGTAQNSARVGDELKLPEVGWTRYDDTSSRISYGGSGWVVENVGGNYLSTTHLNWDSTEPYYSFKFYGTKFRIITAFNNNHATDIKVVIDNENPIIYSENTSSLTRSVLGFEKTGLSVGQHTVKVIKLNTNSCAWSQDAVDIDDNGYLVDPNESISLDKSIMNLSLGDSQSLTATTTPAGVQVTWKSSDESVATVDSIGKVTAIKEGQAVITATTADGLTATCAVTVTPKTTEPTNPDTEPTDSEKIVNIAHTKGDNTNNAGGDVTIIFHGAADTTLSVVKTADVKEVWVGDNFTYTIVVTNTGTKIAKAVVVNDPAPNHIDFSVNGVTSTQGKIDSSSTSKNIIVNVGDIPPLGTVTIKIPATVIL